MSNLPSEDKIRQNTDVKSLQDACIALIQLFHKEETSKKQYRAKAAEFKRQLEAYQLVIQSLQEKNQALEEISRQMSENHKSTSNSSDQNELINSLQTKIKSMEERENELKETISQSQALLNQKVEKITNLEMINKEITSKSVNFQFVIQQQKAEIENLTSQLNGGQVDHDFMVNSNHQLEQEIFNLKQTIEQLNFDLQKQSGEISEISDQLTDKEKENRRILTENKSLCDEKSQLQHQLNISKEKVDGLTEKVNDYHKSFEKFEIERESLIQITENNKNKAKERIEKLKTTNLQQFEQHREENRKNEEEIQKLRDQIQTFTAQLNESAISQETLTGFEIEKSKLTQIISDQETQINDIQKEYNYVLKEIQKYQIIEIENQEKAKEIKELKSILQKNQKELFQSTLTIKECEKAVRDIQGTIDDRDSTILKLKNLLTRSNKSDKRKQQQIDDLQSYIQTVQNKGYQFDEIEKLTSEKEELEEKLRKSKASDELFQQNQKLQEAHDRTNQLYSQLLEDHLKLMKEATFRSEINLSISHDSNCFEYFPEIDENEIAFDIEKLTPKSSSHSFVESEPSNSKKETKLARSAYLRRVLLQFFSEENDSERAEMVPIILELVGCSNEQVSVVMRHLQRNQHLIARTAGFFGY